MSPMLANAEAITMENDRYGGPLLVHAVPDFLKDGAGNWKDVASRWQLWNDLGSATSVVRFDPQKPEDLLGQIPAGATDVLMEYSWWPELLEQLRAQRPELRLHVRTHNAEALQHVARQGLRIWPIWGNLRTVYGAVRLAWRDSRCRRAADCLWGISPWDNRWYWSWLPGRAQVIDFAYFCPWPELRPRAPVPWEERRREIVSMPGLSDRIGQSMQREFEQFSIASRAQQFGKGWRFMMSRGLDGRRPVNEGAMLELLPEPLDAWATLCECRGLAVMGTLGYGLKTNVIDGLAAGCHVLLHSHLAQRLPTDVVSRCVVVDCARRESLERAWDILAEPPVGGPEFVASLREHALAEAKQILAGKAVRGGR